MSLSPNRRRFLAATAASGALLGLGDLAFMSKLRPLSAQETKLDPKAVQFRPEIEPLVRLIEDTPRNRLLEEVAGKIHGGTSYQELLAALFLANVRNVQPRPSVGFKFHSVLVINSAHIASLASPDEDRWLPIFWALDEFKSSQAADVREGNWTMPAVDETKVPPAHQAREAFIAAMDNWDEEAADVAVAGLARTAGADEIYELFARYGSRDFRSIGHKAIYVANSWRTLQCIGWQHSEPILRSLAYALLAREGGANPAKEDLAPDRPWRRNQELAKTLRADWLTGQPNAEATTELLATLRSGSDEDACKNVVDLLNRGVSTQSVYDALFVGAGELLMRQPGIVGLHAVTSTNAFHYSFTQAADDENRKLILLQNAAFLPLFHQAMKGRGNVAETTIEEVAAVNTPENKDEAIADIFQDVSRDRPAAARKILGFVKNDADAQQLMTAARRLIFLKGSNSHDYKFSSAVLEDYYHISPQFRNQFLATSVFNLRGSQDRDNSLVQRTRAALA